MVYVHFTSLHRTRPPAFRLNHNSKIKNFIYIYLERSRWRKNATLQFTSQGDMARGWWLMVEFQWLNDKGNCYKMLLLLLDVLAVSFLMVFLSFRKRLEVNEMWWFCVLCALKLLFDKMFQNCRTSDEKHERKRSLQSISVNLILNFSAHDSVHEF